VAGIGRIRDGLAKGTPQRTGLGTDSLVIPGHDLLFEEQARHVGPKLVNGEQRLARPQLSRRSSGKPVHTQTSRPCGRGEDFQRHPWGSGRGSPRD